MKWFRFYHDAIHDPKVQSLRGDAYKFWVNLLCIASAQPERGSLPPLSNIAFTLHLKPDRVEKLINDFVETGLVDEGEDGRRRIHNWAERQRASDDVAERVRRSRERSHGGPSGAECNGPVTLHRASDIRSAADCNVTPSASARERQRAELERELDLEPAAAGRSAGARPAAAAKGSGSAGSLEECVALARELFSDADAAYIAGRGADIDRKLGGRFDAYAEALREADRRRRRPGGKKIGSLHGFCLTVAPDFFAGPPPPDPEAARAPERHRLTAAQRAKLPEG